MNVNFLYTRKTCALFLKLFLHRLVFQGLQLRIIHMLKWHILEQCILVVLILPFETSFPSPAPRSFIYEKPTWQLQRDQGQGLQEKRSAKEERKQTQVGTRMRKQKMTNLNALPILLNQPLSPGNKSVQLNSCVSFQEAMVQELVRGAPQLGLYVV